MKPENFLSEMSEIVVGVGNNSRSVLTPSYTLTDTDNLEHIINQFVHGELKPSHWNPVTGEDDYECRVTTHDVTLDATMCEYLPLRIKSSLILENVENSDLTELDAYRGFVADRANIQTIGGCVMVTYEIEEVD